MVRIALVGLLIALLAGVHQPYRRATVPVLANGEELMAVKPGLVTFNGTVLRGKIDDKGGKVITLQVDNQQIVAYNGPTLGIGLPHVGAYCSVTGKMLGAGAVSLESKDDLRVLLPVGGLVYQPADKPGALGDQGPLRNGSMIRKYGQRCEVLAERMVIGNKTKRGDTRYVAFASGGRLYHGFAPLEMTKDAAILQGYTNEHGIFIVEGFR